MVFVDQNWKIKAVSSKYNADEQRGFWYAGNPFNKIGNQLLSFTAFSDTVYGITGLAAYPKYVIDFGDKKLPTNFDYNIGFEEFNEKYSNSNYAYMVDNIIELNDFVFLIFGYNKSYGYGFYSKKTSKLYCGSKINNDNNHLGFQKPISFDYKNNILISYYDAYSIAQNKEAIQKANYIDKSVLKLISGVEMNDNPVLVFYKIKRF